MRFLIFSFLFLLFLPIAAIEGLGYGEIGDPTRYAESIEYLLKIYQGQAGGLGLAFVAAPRDPFFHIINVVFADWTGGFNTTAFNISLLSAVLVFSSFVLISANFTQAATRFMFFTGNMVGFLVAFNLYRSAFGLFVLCLIYSAVKRVAKKSTLRLPIGSAIASLFHSLFSILFVVSLIRKKKFWAYPLLIALAAVLYSMIDFSSYLTDAESRSAEAAQDGAAAFPVALAMYVVLGVYVWTKRARLRENEFFTPTLLVGVLLIPLAFLNYNLVYERTLMVFVFGLTILLSEVMRPFVLIGFGFLLLLYNLFSLTGFKYVLGTG